MSPVRAMPLMLSIPHSLTVMCIWDFSHHFQVQDIPKEKPYEVDLNHFFQDVDALFSIAFQIAIHNRRKKAKADGEELPPSKRRGKVKQALIHQGDGIQGTSAAEILEKSSQRGGKGGTKRYVSCSRSLAHADTNYRLTKVRRASMTMSPGSRDVLETSLLIQLSAPRLQDKSERPLLHPRYDTYIQ